MVLCLSVAEAAVVFQQGLFVRRGVRAARVVQSEQILFLHMEDVFEN